MVPARMCNAACMILMVFLCILEINGSEEDDWKIRAKRTFELFGKRGWWVQQPKVAPSLFRNGVAWMRVPYYGRRRMWGKRVSEMFGKRGLMENDYKYKTFY